MQPLPGCAKKCVEQGNCTSFEFAYAVPHPEEWVAWGGCYQLFFEIGDGFFKLRYMRHWHVLQRTFLFYTPRNLTSIPKMTPYFKPEKTFSKAHHFLVSLDLFNVFILLPTIGTHYEILIWDIFFTFFNQLELF